MEVRRSFACLILYLLKGVRYNISSKYLSHKNVVRCNRTKENCTNINFDSLAENLSCVNIDVVYVRTYALES